MFWSWKKISSKTSLMNGHCAEEEGGGWEDTGAKRSNYPRDWVDLLHRPGSKGPMRAGSSEKKEALWETWKELVTFHITQNKTENPKAWHELLPSTPSTFNFGHSTSSLFFQKDCHFSVIFCCFFCLKYYCPMCLCGWLITFSRTL